MPFPEYIDNVKRRELGDDGRYREWDEQGNLTVDAPFTPAQAARYDELTNAGNRQRNASTLDQRAAQAWQDNRAYLAQGSHTQQQVVAQVDALTRQNNAIIQLLTGRLDTTD